MSHTRIFLLTLFLSVFQLSGCADISGTQSGNAQVVILYTNDEHGWMEANENADGAAGMFGLWKEKEGYTEEGNYLILSGGDMWTGPAISTWFEGESMVDVMNAMHYDAATVGNHEFDFKIEGLRKRSAQSKFPYLGANICEKSTGKIPDFIKPYIIKEIDGIKIGIIGLGTISTPRTTFPDNVADYDFIPYIDALNEVVPDIKKEGAEFLIVNGHLCSDEMKALAPEAKRLGIALVTGGHCHELYSDTLDGVVMVEAGSFMQSYARIDLTIDRKTKKVISVKPGLQENKGATPDSVITAIVSGWKENLNRYLSEVIGYADKKIDRNSDAMYNMITDSWLITFPDADISFTNIGGIRQDIPQGDISLEAMVGLLPFANSIVKIKMTGQEIKDGITNSLVFGGMTMAGGYKLSDGTPIYEDSVYQVLTTDYLYSRPDYSFQHVDASPVRTAVHYRQPVIDWIKSLHTSDSKPLNAFLDFTRRQ